MNTQQTNTIKKEEINQGFNLVYDGDFADAYQMETTFLCIARSPYIPIEAFKVTFNEISKAISNHGGASKFIFDKRALRSFHQPSMEWYYTDWKINLYQKFGLTQHRKILPNEKWFHKCVEAVKNQIFEEHPDLDISMLEIKYAASIQEAVDN